MNVSQFNPLLMYVHLIVTSFFLYLFILFLLLTPIDLPGGANGKESTCQCWRHKRLEFDPWVQKIPLQKGMATHSSILAWRISWTEEPGRLQTMGSYSP